MLIKFKNIYLYFIYIFLYHSTHFIMDKIHNYLIASLRHDNGYYHNKIEANHPYPCGICQKNVGNNQKAVYCTMCELWIHIKCNGTTNEE